MAEAGFYYSGGVDGDAVTCFMCAKDLDGWEEGDDPMAEHEKHAPACPWMNLQLEENRFKTFFHWYVSMKCHAGPRSERVRWHGTTLAGALPFSKAARPPTPPLLQYPLEAVLLTVYPLSTLPCVHNITQPGANHRWLPRTRGSTPIYSNAHEGVGTRFIFESVAGI